MQNTTVNLTCYSACFLYDTDVVVVVFFTLTDRASTIPNNTRGCQSGTWSAGQKKIRGHLPSSNESKEKHKHTNDMQNVEILSSQIIRHSRFSCDMY